MASDKNSPPGHGTARFRSKLRLSSAAAGQEVHVNSLCLEKLAKLRIRHPLGGHQVNADCHGAVLARR